MRYTPHAYQREAIKFMIERATAGLFLDPGLGKTSIVLAAFKLLQKQAKIKNMLVVAPLRVAQSVWPKEVEKWSDFSHLKVVVLDQAARAQKETAKTARTADVCVINPEGLDWLVRQQIPFDVLVVDESTKFKHARTERFRTLKPWLPQFKRRYILTGSPAPNGLLDLWGQVFILDFGTSLGRTFSAFRSRYFVQAGQGGFLQYKWSPRRGADKEIYDALRSRVLRMDARDLLDMPPLIGVDPPGIVEVTLPALAMKQYQQMERTLIAELADGKLAVAVNAAAATMKCRQIANGGIYTHGAGQAKAWSQIHDAKVEAVEEIIEELQGKPALVAYEFEHDLARLRARLGKDTPWIGGGVPASRFREIEAAWNDGALPVLLAQPQSVAHGLNLQGTGAAVIWAGLTWDLEVYQQFYQRVWRQGQKEKIIVHHVVAKDTVDEVIVKGLSKKDRSQQALLSALKDYARARGTA